MSPLGYTLSYFSSMSTIKVVKVIGGLGNQMFQVCFYEWLRRSFPQYQSFIDLQSFENYSLHNGYLMNAIFGYEANLADQKVLRKMGEYQKGFVYRVKRRMGIKNNLIWEETEHIRFQFHDKKIVNQKNQYFDGYWQAYHYPDLFDNIKLSFRFPDLTDQENLKVVKEINDASASVSVHVRRGDYVNHPKYKDICTAEYYQKAIQSLSNQYGELKCFVFSNDIPWCQENLNLPNAIYVDHNFGANSYKDMQLMGYCQHHIIANSSFSWWGAYLSQKQGSTIAPKKWKNNMEGTRDLIPPHWIQL